MVRDAWHIQNGWIFGKVPKGGGGVIFRAVESESLKKSKSRKKSDKVGKVGFDFLLDFWQKQYFINGDVLNAE